MLTFHTELYSRKAYHIPYHSINTVKYHTKRLLFLKTKTLFWTLLSTIISFKDIRKDFTIFFSVNVNSCRVRYSSQFLLLPLAMLPSPLSAIAYTILVCVIKCRAVVRDACVSNRMRSHLKNASFLQCAILGSAKKSIHSCRQVGVGGWDVWLVAFRTYHAFFYF
jgi:hypothetical protein